MKMQSNYKVTSDCRIKGNLVQEGDNITGRPDINNIRTDCITLKKKTDCIMEEINKAYATFRERDRIASLGGGVRR